MELQIHNGNIWVIHLEKQFVELNGKTFEINDDVLMCLLDDFEEHPESKEVRKALIMDLLLPTPTDKDYRAMRKSTFIEIMSVDDR